ncbi:MAG: enoyl-CoA hydratase/isomerase family protein [Deltaproteobacteria bacterium]|nr:enoyl-CoA hydratase/isomerase family protein [Deltaproteobacteria bacterium]
MRADLALERLRERLPSLPPRAGRVHLELGDRLATLTLDNPGERGAITVAMMLQLAEAVAALEAWGGAALVVRSTCSRVFCAGAHLGDLGLALPGEEGGEVLSSAMGAVLDRLWRLPILTVGRWEGLAVGGGAELLTALDHRVAGPRATIRFVHGALGLSPGWGGAGRLAALVGRSGALRLLSTAATVPAAGPLVDAHAEGDLDQAVAAFLAPVLALPDASIRGAKRAVVGAMHRPDQPGEAQVFQSLWWGPDHLARRP